jgi:hypothetical protein
MDDQRAQANPRELCASGASVSQLSGRLWAVLFADAADYITGGPLVRQIPSNLRRGYRLARTFETRVPNQLQVLPPSLQAMFIDQVTISTLALELKHWIHDLQDRGVMIRAVVTTRKPMERHVEDYLLSELGLAV